MPSFVNNVNLNKNEIQNARIQNLSTAPASPVGGQIYFDTDDNNLYVYDGTAWLPIKQGAISITDATSSVKGIIQLGGDLNGSGSSAASPVISAGAIDTTKLATGAVTNLKVDSAAAIAYSKLNLATSIVNGDISSSAAIAYSKLSLSASIVNADVASGAAIAYSKLSLGTSITTSDLATATTLNDIATSRPATGTVTLSSQRIINLADPNSAQDAATKAYVDTTAQGLDAKASVKAATTADITLSGTQTIDGIALSIDDRVLVKSQTAPAENGLYLVKSGAWVRTTDANSWEELVSAFTFVEQGTLNGDNGYICTVDAGGTLGTTAVSWTQFSGAGQITAGAGLTKSGNTLDVGAGTGITVNANDVAIDTSVVMRRFAASIGDTTTTTFTVTHSLGTKDVHVAVFDNSTNAEVFADIAHASTSTVTVAFSAAPTTNQYRVVVIG